MIKFIKLLCQNILFCCIFIFAIRYTYADNLPLSVFPLVNYPQQTTMWFNTKASQSSQYNITQRLLSREYQNKHLMQLKQHYFGTELEDTSPWAVKYVQQQLINNGDKDFFNKEQELITRFTNHSNKSNAEINVDDMNTGYGINYLPYSSKWSMQIADNMLLNQFKHLVYNKSHRAITVNNLAARVVPTYDPWFLNYKIAGEGYPFDYNQESKIDIATPIYVVGTTKDKLWSLVITPYITAWVETHEIAFVDDVFIKIWQQHAQTGLVVITKPDTSLIDSRNITHNIAYVAAIFPLHRQLSSGYEILIPIRNNISGMASIGTAKVANNDSALMPLPATIGNFMMLIDRLHGRPYSWGGRYNYNDCSAEIQNIFIPLGYFMPRNSEQQLLVGTVVDLSGKTPASRQDYLIKHGQSLLTLIYIKGHVMLYIGNTDYYGNKIAPMTYQNMWSLMPADRSYRFLIGQSVFMPLLLNYPENSTIDSQLNKSIFKLIFLNERPLK